VDDDMGREEDHVGLARDDEAQEKEDERGLI